MSISVSAQMEWSILFVVDQSAGVCVHGLHKRTHTLRIHVRVQTVAEVGDVTPGAERLHHCLYNVRNALLNKHICVGLYCAFLPTCLVLMLVNQNSAFKQKKV